MNILIIHTAFIGDIVLSTALIEKIYEKYKGANIYFLTVPVCASILKNNPKLSGIISYDKKGKDKGFLGYIKILKKIRKLKIDICFTPHRYLKSTLLTFFSGARERIGYKIAPLSFLFTKKVEYDNNKHEVEKLLSFVDAERDRYELKLYPTFEEEQKIDELLKYESKNIVIIAPGSKWFTKQWPSEYFTELIKRLEKKDKFSIVIVGGEEEKKINLSLSEKILDLRGKTSLLELAELIKRSKIVVTNDSSPVHIASAFNETKIIAIFGPTVKSFGFFPWSKNSVVFENNNLKCRPCGKHGGRFCPEEHFRCMRDIKPQDIEQEILKGTD